MQRKTMETTRSLGIAWAETTLYWWSKFSIKLRFLDIGSQNGTEAVTLNGLINVRSSLYINCRGVSHQVVGEEGQRSAQKKNVVKTI